MKLNLDELTKRYYSIGEVAEIFEVSKSLIRFWEAEFDSLKPHKNSKGDRRFTKQNIEQLLLIYNLVKERGFTLKGAKQEIQEKKEMYFKRDKTIKKLKEIRKFLVKLRDQG